MCGNGIRCLGKYVYDYRLTGKETLSIETKSGIRNMHLHIQDGKACGAMVDMGVPRLNAHSIPILSKKDLVINDPIEVQEKNYRMTGISMGNPHAVIPAFPSPLSPDRSHSDSPPSADESHGFRCRFR